MTHSPTLRVNSDKHYIISLFPRQDNTGVVVQSDNAYPGSIPFLPNACLPLQEEGGILEAALSGAASLRNLCS
jgi:hypothetical protein